MPPNICIIWIIWYDITWYLSKVFVICTLSYDGSFLNVTSTIRYDSYGPYGMGFVGYYVPWIIFYCRRWFIPFVCTEMSELFYHWTIPLSAVVVVVLLVSTTAAMLALFCNSTYCYFQKRCFNDFYFLLIKNLFCHK